MYRISRHLTHDFLLHVSTDRESVRLESCPTSEKRFQCELARGLGTLTEGLNENEAAGEGREGLGERMIAGEWIRILPHDA